jgi:hypothetical protein
MGACFGCPFGHRGIYGGPYYRGYGRYGRGFYPGHHMGFHHRWFKASLFYNIQNFYSIKLNVQKVYFMYLLNI